MSWAHPEAALAVALAWLGLAAAVLAARRGARRRLVRLLGAPGRRLPVRRDLLLLAAAAAIAVAWLGPRAGTRTLRLPASGIDVVVLIDVSRSMEARDAAPSRLARARRSAAQALARLRAGDRAALAVFAGHGALLTPLTPDKRALVEMLDGLDTELMSDRGSDAAAGVARALEAFEAGSLRPRVLLLLSDGESASLAEQDVARQLARQEVRLVAALFGDPKGSEIPEGRGVLQHPSGRPVVTARRSEAAAALAEATRGELLLADPFGRIDPEALAAALRAGARPGPGGTLEHPVPVERFAWPALLALLLLLAEALPSGWARGLLTRRAPTRRGLATQAKGPTAFASPRGVKAGARAGAAGLLLLALLGAGDGREQGTSPAREADRMAEMEQALRQDPDRPATLIALGVARARQGDAEEARRAFSAAALRARDPELTAAAYYDLGVLAMEARDFARARDAFFDALALDPADRDAKRNLEWVLRALGTRQRAEAPGRPQESQSPRPQPDPEAAPRPPGEKGEEDEKREQSDRDAARARRPTQRAGAESRPSEPRTGEAGEAEARSQRPLAPDEAARWLDAVRDDPGRALRRAAAAQAGERRPRGGPRW